MSDFLTFRRMITPLVIQFIFWLAVIGVVLAGCATIAGAALMPRQGQDSTTMILGVLGGLALIVIGPIVVRIYAELLIVLFKMHDALEEMSKSLAELKPTGRPQ